MKLSNPVDDKCPVESQFSDTWNMKEEAQFGTNTLNPSFNIYFFKNLSQIKSNLTKLIKCDFSLL